MGSSPEHPDAIAELLQIEAQRLARDIEGYIAELNDLGVMTVSQDDIFYAYDHPVEPQNASSPSASGA